MEDQHSLVAWARNERQAILDEMEPYESGARVEQTRQGGFWLDSTPRAVKQLKSRAARLANGFALDMVKLGGSNA